MKQTTSKRSLLLLLCGIAAAGLTLTGWGWFRHAEAERSASSYNEEIMPAEQTGAGDKLVVIFPAGAMPPDLDAVEAEMNRYLATRIHASVELKPIERGSWWDKTGFMFSSKQQIDLMFTAGWFGFGNEVTKGQLVPLDDLLDRYGQGIKSILNPSIVDAGKLDGRIYGIVANKEFASSKGLVMRKDLVDKYRFDLSSVRKLEDLEPLLATVKIGEDGIVPLQVRSDRSPFTFLMQYGLFDMLGDGPGVLPRGGGGMKVVNMLETPEFAHYAELMHRWNEAGLLNPDAATTKDNEFEAVKAGTAFAYAESLKPGFANQASRDTGMTMVSVELTAPYTTTADTTSAMFAITKNARHPEKAMMLLNLLYTDKYLLNLLDWGIEGKHYIKRSDSQIDYPPGVEAKTVGYNLNQPWMFGNQLLSYLWTNENPDLWEQYKQFNQKAEKSKALGFVFNPDRVKNEIAACANVEKQFAPAIYTGALDPAQVLPLYIEKLKAAGADRVIEEKQRQLDIWLNSKPASR